MLQPDEKDIIPRLATLTTIGDEHSSLNLSLDKNNKNIQYEHNITQSMSGKGICMDNGAMENFFGRLKVEMFYGYKFSSVEDFIQKLHEYIYYYNNERISLKLNGMSPMQYRTHYQN